MAALIKLDLAVRTIEGMIAGGSVTPAQATVLRQVETRLILAAKWTYLTLMPGNTNQQKRDEASALAQRADTATALRDYVSAIGHWLAAIRLLAPAV